MFQQVLDTRQIYTYFDSYDGIELIHPSAPRLLPAAESCTKVAVYTGCKAALAALAESLATMQPVMHAVVGTSRLAGLELGSEGECTAST